MKRIILFMLVSLIATVSYAQKDNSDKEKKEKDQDTKITPGASGVKRSIGYRFSSITNDSDPGKGVFRYNNKNISAVTFIIVDKNDIKGEDQTNWYSTWDKTTGATGRGRLTLVELEGNNVNVFDITDVFIDGKGYWKLPVEYVSGTLPQNDSVYYYVFERIAHGRGSDKDKEKVEDVEEVEVVEPSFAEATDSVRQSGLRPSESEGREEPVAEVVAEAEPVVEEVEEVIAEAEEVVEEAEEVIEEAEPVVEEPVAEVAEEAPVVVLEEPEEVVEEAPEVIVEEPEEVAEAAAEVPVVEEAVAEAAPVVVEEPSLAEATDSVRQSGLPPSESEDREEPVAEVVPEAPAGEVIKAPPVAEPKPVPEPKPEPKAKPAAPVAETVTQPEKVTDEAPAPPRTETKTVPEPARERERDTQTTVGAGRRTISSTKPATQPPQETKTTTVARETRTEPAKQPSQQTQTTIATVRQTVTVTQPAPTPERKPLPEPEKGPPAQIALQPVEETQKEPVTQPVPEKKYDDFPVVQNYYQSSGGRSHGKWYRGIIEIGYALRISEYGMNNFRFNFINGFNIKNTSIGLGIGVRKYYDKPSLHPDWHLVSGDVQIPVFLDVRTRFSSKTFTPYLGIGIGGSQGFNSDTTNNKSEGLYFHATGGLWINLSDRFAIFGGFAYEMQKLEYANFSDEIPYKKNTNSISINIGIAF
jgi:opacity protein-like surface antigen